MHELIKALEIKTSIVFNLYFTSKTIFLCFFDLVLDNWVIFLIVAVNVQIYNPTAELAMLTGTPTNEANEEFETQTLTAETKDRKCSK